MEGVEYSVDVGRLVAAVERYVEVAAVVVAAWPVAAFALPAIEDVADGGAFVVGADAVVLALVVGVSVVLGAVVVSVVPASKVEGGHEGVTCEVDHTARTDSEDAEKAVPAYRGNSLS